MCLVKKEFEPCHIISHSILLFSIFHLWEIVAWSISVCTFRQEEANDGTKEKIEAENAQDCANKCFQMKLGGETGINAVTFEIEDPTACYCNKHQTKTKASIKMLNCKLKLPDGISLYKSYR